MNTLLLVGILIALIVDGVITNQWLKTSRQYFEELRDHVAQFRKP